MTASSLNKAVLLAEALKGLSRGWSFTPLTGKKPVERSWTTRPPSTETHVRQWIEKGHNLGLRTGHASKITVIDDDSEDGAGARALDLPATVTVVTGSGRRHYYFVSPQTRLGNSASKLHDRVDVRGDGGQVVFPGSIHPNTGQPYRWLEGHSPEEIEIAQLPACIIQRLQPNERVLGASAQSNAACRPPAPPPPQACLIAQRRLKKAVAEVANATEGERNHTLNRLAFALGGYVGAGVLDRRAVEEKLFLAARAIDLPEDEAQATIASGLDAGMRHPADLEALTAKALRRKARRGRIAPPFQPDSPAAGLAIGQALPSEGDIPEVGTGTGRQRITYHELGNDVPLHKLVPAAVSALANHCEDVLYVRGGMLARVTGWEIAADEGIRRGPGLRIREVPEPILRELLDRAAVWIETKETKKGEIESVEKWAPRAVVAAVRELGEWPGLKPLLGVVEAPTMRPDGSVLDKIGYDSPTAFIYKPARDYPPTAEQPTPEDVRRAWGELLDPFREFPLDSPCDRASLAALMLTIAGRPAIDGPVPHWAVMAPTFGAGKTLLVEVAGIAMTGVAPDAMAPVGGRSADAEAEMRKRLTTLVLEAPRAAVIDNFPDGGTFESKAFAALLTSDRWTDRILGRSEKVSLPHRIVWITTGCNFRLWGDLARRSLSILIDPSIERPHLRSFEIEDLTAYVHREHPRLLAAALTVLRGFVVAGRPSHSRALLGKFEAWDRLVRAAVIWASGLCSEVHDPLGSAVRLQDEAPDRSSLGELVAAWTACFHPGVPVTAKDAVEASKQDMRLRDAIVGIGGAKRGEPDPRMLGNRLRVLSRRVADGMAFRADDNKKQGAVQWRVLEAAGKPGSHRSVAVRGAFGNGGGASTGEVRFQEIPIEVEGAGALRPYSCRDEVQASYEAEERLAIQSEGSALDSPQQAIESPECGERLKERETP